MIFTMHGTSNIHQPSRPWSRVMPRMAGTKVFFIHSKGPSCAGNSNRWGLLFTLQLLSPGRNRWSSRHSFTPTTTLRDEKCWPRHRLFTFKSPRLYIQTSTHPSSHSLQSHHESNSKNSQSILKVIYPKIKNFKFQSQCSPNPNPNPNIKKTPIPEKHQ